MPTGDGFVAYARGAETRARQPGLEGQPGFHLPRRRPRCRKGRSRWSRCRATSMPPARHGRAGRRRGEPDEAPRWRSAPQALQAAVEAQFWLDELGYYALALDGEGELCRVRALEPRPPAVLGPADSRSAPSGSRRSCWRAGFNSGWGMRTLAAGEARFNPMSYHNGSVWPHDTALCAGGHGAYGERDGVAQADWACSRPRSSSTCGCRSCSAASRARAGEPPIAYPVACLPQAWASGSVFMMLQACLGLSIDGWRGEIHIDRPRLPTRHRSADDPPSRGRRRGSISPSSGSAVASWPIPRAAIPVLSRSYHMPEPATTID